MKGIVCAYNNAMDVYLSIKKLIVVVVESYFKAMIDQLLSVVGWNYQERLLDPFYGSIWHNLRTVSMKEMD